MEVDRVKVQLTSICSSFNTKERTLIDEEIERLININVIKPVKFNKDLIISPIYLVDKKSGGKRMILNLKMFNQFVPYKHFKMEHFESILNLISPNDFMATFDIKDAYYSVAIAEEDKKYFSF